MSNIVTGIFTLSGLIVGVLLEPLKAVFAAKSRNRQQRNEQSAIIIQCASDSGHIALNLNYAYRARMAGESLALEPEMNLVKEYNQVRDQLRKSVMLLRLHGPDGLANKALEVNKSDNSLYELLQESNSGEFSATEVPERVQEAANVLAEQIMAFAELARKHST
ncbi:hypothetical protein [Allokutzneria multivorans]|uniref:hypothetical protein n=1 Tax=Allokutzneria multivorans TaxID=1142134 RepID=UPI0031EE679B